MKHASLFSGIGGFDLAASWMGWENVFQVEIDAFCQKVLQKHFPQTIRYGDIKATDFTDWRGKIDIISGGFPCQPYSLAGKRLGKEDERHLWPEMLRAIREIQPSWVVGENVRGLTNWNGGLVFDEVQADLETKGYEVLPFLLPAAGVKAPHERSRIFFIAHAYVYICNGNIEFSSTNNQGVRKRMEKEPEPYALSGGGIIADSNGPGLPLGVCREFGSIKGQAESFKRRESARIYSENIWKEFPIESPICRADDGISDRVDRVTSLGNAIVPQVAFEIFKAIEAYENLNP